MRFLIIPLVETKKGGDSYEHVTANFIRYALENDAEKHWFYVFAPREAELPVLSGLDNVTIVRTEKGVMRSAFREAIGYFDVVTLEELFGQIEGIYPVDVVVNEIPGTAFMVDMALNMNYARRSIAQVLYEMRTISKEAKTYFDDEIEIRARAMAYATYYGVFPSKEDMEEAFRSYREYLSPVLVDEMKNRMRYGDGSVYWRDLEEFMEGVRVEKRPRFTVMYGGKLVSTKRVDLVMDVYEKMMLKGDDVDFVVTTYFRSAHKNLLERLLRLKRVFKTMEIYTGVSRRQFWEHVMRSHVFLYAGTLDNLSLALIEVMYLGTTPIVMRKTRTMERIFGSDYPFFWKDVVEAVAMIEQIRDNYEWALDSIQKAVENVRRILKGGSEFSVLLATAREAVEEVYGLHPYPSVPVFKAMIKKLWSDVGREVTIYDIVNAYKWATKRSGVKAHYTSPGIADLYKTVVEAGGVDKYNSEVPIIDIEGVDLDVSW